MILILVQTKITCSHLPHMFKPKTHSTHSQILETSYKASYRGIQSLFDFIMYAQMIFNIVQKKKCVPLAHNQRAPQKILEHLKCHIKQAKGVFKACLILFVGSELKNCKTAAEKPHLPLPHYVGRDKMHSIHLHIPLMSYKQSYRGIQSLPHFICGPKATKRRKKAKKKTYMPSRTHFPLPPTHLHSLLVNMHHSPPFCVLWKFVKTSRKGSPCQNAI